MFRVDVLVAPTLVDFLAALFAGCDGFVELRAFPNTARLFADLVAWPPRIIGPFLTAHAAQDVYFGVSSRRDRTGGDLAHCHHLGALFVDVDFKKTPEPDARERIARCPLRPSAIVHSGGGLHVYWLLREPLALPDATDQTRGLLRRLAVALGGDLASAEPARILRVPGTLNHKPQYGTPRPVVIEQLDPTSRYNPHELDEWLPAAPTPEVTRGRFTMPDQVLDGTRNDTLWRLARSLKARGLSLRAILNALEAENDAKCDPPLAPGDLADIAQHAMSHPDRPLPEPLAHPGGAGVAGARGLPAQEAPEHLTDAGNALRLVSQHVGLLRYVREARTWAAWDGRRLVLGSDAAVMELAKQTARALYAEAATGADSERRSALGRWAIRSEGEARLRAMVALASSDARVLVPAATLDADPDQLNVDNGLLRLSTGALGPHDPAASCTRLAPVAYDPDAPCPRWLAFLRRILGDDAALLDFVQRALGYALTGRPIEQVVFFLHGTGANGKSTLLNVVSRVLGDYARFTSVESFLSRPREGAGIGNDLVRLRGARFVWGMEPEAGRRLAESLIKSVTGGDQLIGRRLYGEFEEFPATFSVFLGCNHKPQIRGTDHAIWRRVRLIPFRVTIPESEQDKTLADRLVTEEGAGILAWLVAGATRWREEGLGLPEAVQTATADYREEQDTLGGFFADCCRFAPEATVSVRDLYEAYTSWALKSCEKTVTKTQFGQRVVERGMTAARTKHERSWQGVRLRGVHEDHVPAASAAGAGVIDPW